MAENSVEFKGLRQVQKECPIVKSIIKLKESFNVKLN